MSPSVENDRVEPGRPRRRLVRLTAVGVTVGVAAAAIVGSTGATAGAVALPKAQSVGRFVDGSVGGNAIQQLADVVDARAKASPDSSSRNPLEAKLLGQLDIPLGNALQLPGGGALNLGAANQLADAKTNGASLGASGAVSNSGGVSLGGDNSAFPSDAKLNLTAAALGSVTLPGASSLPGLPTIPGLPTGSLSALGGITGSIGAVSGIVQTAKGGKIITPKSSVASVKLNIGSPALGGLLGQLTSLLNPSVLTNLIPTSSLPTGSLNNIPIVGGVLGGILGGVGAPTGGTTSTSCALTSSVPTSISLDQGAVVIDVAKATITVDVGKLLKVVLGKDISNLDTSNFDLIDFLVTNLPKILSTGLTSLVTGITGPLEDQFKACVSTLNAIPILGSVTTGLINQLLSVLDQGQKTLLNAISTITTPLTSASGAPLTALASGLKQVIDIGLNVQSGPGIQKKDTTYPFTSGLKATPNQATAVVKNQTLVRAIEIDILSAAGGATGSLPALPLFRQAAAPRAAAAAGGVAVLALGNAAAGPSTLTEPSSSPTAPGSTTPNGPPTGNPVIPTGVPAGAAGHFGGGTPVLPIVVVLLGLMLAGGGVTAYRVRGKFSPGH